MKKYELLKLRELLNKEISRRKRIKELLECDLVKEYLSITNTPWVNLDINDIRGILSDILLNYKVTSTNNIYVATRAYFLDCTICYQETNYFRSNVPINSLEAENKIYKDIESESIVVASSLTDSKMPLISTFESENIVLNPYNTSNNKNGYDDVRLDFFSSSAEQGQAKAKKLILEKYKKM